MPGEMPRSFAISLVDSPMACQADDFGAAGWHQVLLRQLKLHAWIGGFCSATHFVVSLINVYGYRVYVVYLSVNTLCILFG